MSCIVYAFAAAPDLVPVSGAAPWPVLARQLPRELVALLNVGRDRGVRFLPWIGVVDGQRRFLDPTEQFPAEALLRFHAQTPAPELLVDGMLTADEIHVRAIDGVTAADRLVLALPFDPCDPWPALRHIAFELGERLGILGAPAPRAALVGGPLASWLPARDVLLTLEANLLHPGRGAVLQVVRTAFDAAPDAEPCRAVLIGVCRALVLAGERGPEIASALCGAVGAFTVEEAIEAARVASAAAGSTAALPLWSSVSQADPTATEAVIQASAGLFEAGREAEMRELLRAAHAAGNHDPDICAQLAAVEELGGDLTRRDALLAELRTFDVTLLSPKAQRLLASWLIDRGECFEAMAILDELEASAPDLAGLWLERGRALLSLGRAVEARRALERCLELRPSQDGCEEARRLLRYSHANGYVSHVLELEACFARGELRSALRLAKRIVRQRRSFSESWLLLGLAQHRLGRLRRAARAFRNALRLDAHSAEAHHRLGLTLAQRGRPEQGFTHLRYAVELAPQDAPAWIHFAQVAGLVGRADEVARAVRNAERLGAGDHEALLAVKARLDGDH